ncbi:MAG: DUF192 domain-containing protein [Gemmatimonadetes bacterium]|nr:DUF192 domain-containing protein [Gemmatimonadota bacterium]
MADRGRRRRAVGRLWLLAAALSLPTGCLASEQNPPVPPTTAADPAAAPPSAVGTSTPAAPPFGKALVIFGRDTVIAEVARTTEERERGLMYRNDVPEGTGMMFVFTDEEVRSFWMSNTYVALDVAFMDSSLRVVDVEQMEPETTQIHDSSAPAMYALEVPKGWLAAHGVRVGTRARMVVSSR